MTINFTSCLEKQRKVKNIFERFTSDEEKYAKIIECGKLLLPLPLGLKTEENLVHGCQSKMYLHSTLVMGNVLFQAESDALISSGLAWILIEAYSDEPPEVILKCPPSYLEELGIGASLSPSRANGLYSMHLRMKQDALKLLLKKEA